MEENKSKNKKIIFIVVAIVIVVVLAVLIVAGMFVNDIAQQAIISQEIEKINKAGTVDEEIKAKGKYAELEKTIKDYVLEYQGVAKEIQEQYKNEKFTNILAAENLQNDGPEFVESKKLISDVTTKGEEVKTKLAEMVSEDYKVKLAEEKGLNGKYKDLLIQNLKLEQELKTVNSTIDNVNNYLAKIDDVFNYLKENKDNWKVNNNRVEFTQMSMVTKYNSLLTLVNIAAQKIK